MLALPTPHPQRQALSDEAHARPPQALRTPSCATYVAMLVGAASRAAEADHVAALCRSFSVAPPASDANHFSAVFADGDGAPTFTWERHGEFSGFTVARGGDGDEPAASGLPAGWLAGLPGETLAAVHAVLLPEPAAGVDSGWLAARFAGNAVVGASVGEGAGVVATDLRLHADGFARFVLLDRSLTPRQAGRTLQRLFEIEAYRMLAMLALPVARRQLAEMATIEAELASLTGDFATGAVEDDALLQQVTSLAGRVENALAASQFRFGACRAYAELVATRIAELREQRLPGMQTIAEFMDRRFRPAVSTCATASQRLHDLSERIARASTLLSTRVDIVREKQNQRLLESMDRRTRAQLRLQQTVEGLSVAAIVYYAAGLVGYVAKGLKSRGVALDADVVVAASIPVLAVLVLMAMRRARRHARASN